MTDPRDIAEDIELKLFAEALVQRYGYDFRGYSDASFKRRVKSLVVKNGQANISALTHAILNDERLFSTLLSEITVTTSEMFRDPAFFEVLRARVLPVLSTYPSFRIWHAGCGSGEEVYSLAILLAEEGLASRGVIYATDINPAALERAKEGIYPAELMQRFTANYQAAGGREPFSRYYTAGYGAARMAPELRANILFSEHNLVTDGVFAEMQLILCRNVLIYFKRELQSRALGLFAESLSYKGFLALGSKETVRFMDGQRAFEDYDAEQRIYRKIRRAAEADA